MFPSSTLLLLLTLANLASTAPIQVHPTAVLAISPSPSSSSSSSSSTTTHTRTIPSSIRFVRVKSKPSIVLSNSITSGSSSGSNVIPPPALKISPAKSNGIHIVATLPNSAVIPSTSKSSISTSSSVTPPVAVKVNTIRIETPKLVVEGTVITPVRILIDGIEGLELVL